MTVELLRIVETTHLGSDQIAHHAEQIHATVLQKSPYIRTANFSRVHPTDLLLLYTEYDARFFHGRVRESLGSTLLTFRLSKRMTRIGGQTARYIDQRSGTRRYEISVATTMLYGCFREDDHRPISVCGFVCRDRLDALQRVMEHELVHLVEMLLWNQSSCSAERFHSISRRLFGHTENCHQLITPRERASVQFGIHAGMLVRFQFEGRQFTGIVNRISKRATVLVEDGQGEPYSNGKRYRKFYVPVPSLEAVPR